MNKENFKTTTREEKKARVEKAMDNMVFQTIKKPPSNIELEKMLVSKMIASPGIIPFVVAKIDSLFFTSDKLRKVYNAVVTADKKKAKLDSVSIHNELTSEGKRIINTQDIQSLIDLTTDAKGYQYDIDVLSDLAKRRKAIGEIIGVATDLYNVECDAKSAVNTCIDALSAVKNDSLEESAEITNASDKFLKFIDDGRNSEGDYNGMETGIKKIDLALRGINKGELILCGARPSVGKTTLIINMLLGLTENGYRTYFCSMEQKIEQVYAKLMANKCNINASKFKQAKTLTDGEMKSIMDMDDYLRRIDLKIDGKASRTVSDIEAIIIREKHKNGLDCIAIDYLTIMGFEDVPSIYRGSMNLTLTYVMKKLKAIAKDHDVAIIVLSQLNRAGNDRPTMTSFRESGSLEQEADLAILLHAERDDKEQFKDDRVEFILAKSRNDELGIVTMEFNRAHQRFS